MSLFSQLNHRSDEVSLVLDIASGTVGGAIVKFSKGQPAHILYTCRELILFKTKPTAQSMLSEITKRLAEVARRLSTEGIKHVNTLGQVGSNINHIYYLFSSPWVVSHTKVITVRKDDEFRVTKREINQLVHAEEEEYVASLTLVKDDSRVNSNSKIIEHAQIAMKVNGYETSRPYGKMARTVSIPFFMSIIDEPALDTIEHTVAKYFNFRKGSSHSFSLALYTALRDIFSSDDDFLAVDVNGELTDIMLIKNGILTETSSFPLGINSIIRHVANALKSTPEVAESLIQIYMNNKAEPTAEKKIATILAGIHDEWVDNFERAFTDLNPDVVMPKKLFLIVNNNLSNFFGGFLKNERFKHIVIPGDTFGVTLLDAPKMNTYCTISTDTSPDSFLMLQSIALNSLIHKHQV